MSTRVFKIQYSPSLIESLGAAYSSGRYSVNTLVTQGNLQYYRTEIDISSQSSQRLITNPISNLSNYYRKMTGSILTFKLSQVSIQYDEYVIQYHADAGDSFLILKVVFYGNDTTYNIPPQFTLISELTGQEDYYINEWIQTQLATPSQQSTIGNFLSIPNNLIFDTESERDQYFINNPYMLIENPLYISVNNELQQYVENTWINITPLIMGPQGDNGITPNPNLSTYTWWLGSVDTGIACTPRIDDTTKHWMLGTTDTGVNAQGTNGIDGQDGIDGLSLTWTYDQLESSMNLSQFTDSGVAIGWKVFSTISKSIARITDINGQIATISDITSLKGDQGATPYIGANSNWWVAGVDTGVSATGPKGDDGTKFISTSYELNQSVTNSVPISSLSDSNVSVSDMLISVNNNSRGRLCRVISIDASNQVVSCSFVSNNIEISSSIDAYSAGSNYIQNELVIINNQLYYANTPIINAPPTPDMTKFTALNYKVSQIFESSVPDYGMNASDQPYYEKYNTVVVSEASGKKLLRANYSGISNTFPVVYEVNNLVVWELVNGIPTFTAGTYNKFDIVTQNNIVYSLYYANSFIADGTEDLSMSQDWMQIDPTELWVANTDYSLGSVITYSGSMYKCKAGNIPQATFQTTIPGITKNWDIIGSYDDLRVSYLGVVTNYSSIPTTPSTALSTFGITPSIGDYVKVISDGSAIPANSTTYRYVTAITSSTITWGDYVLINPSAQATYQEKTAASDSGKILVGGSTAGTFGTSIDPTTLEVTANKGAANGYAPLDSNQKVPTLNIDVSAILQSITGYDGSKTQILKNVNGTFTWVDEVNS